MAVFFSVREALQNMMIYAGIVHFFTAKKDQIGDNTIIGF